MPGNRPGLAVPRAVTRNTALFYFFSRVYILVVMFFFGPLFGLLPLIFIVLIVRGLTSMMRGRQGFFPGYEFEHHLQDLQGESTSRERELRIKIFKLAYRHKGRITVSDIIAETGLSGDDAESLIQGMVDNTRVRMEVTDSGVVVYEFPEIISRFDEG